MILPRLFKTYTIDDIKIPILDESKLKQKTRILVVDDKEFDKLEALRTHGYNITKVNEWSSIKDALDYQIIVSDNKDVGTKFGSSRDGAYVLAEVKRQYPQKECVLYSSSMIDIRGAKMPEGIKYLKKNDDIEEWNYLLLSLIKDLYNPKKIWNKLNNELTSNCVERSKIQELEDNYVRQYLSNTLDQECIKPYKVYLSGDSFSFITNLFSWGVNLYSLLHG